MREGSKGVVAAIFVITVIVGVAALAGISGVAQHGRTVRGVDEKWERLLIEKGYGTYREGKFVWNDEP